MTTIARPREIKPSVDLKFCKQIPKIELHAHINGSISPDTLEALARRKATFSSDLGGTLDGIRRWRMSVEGKEIRSLPECFETFSLIHKVVNDVESIVIATHDVIKEFADDGVRYLELRSTPKDNPETGMTKRLYIDAVLRGIEQCESEGINIIVKFLPSIDRRMAVMDASEVVDLALEYSATTDSRVVGIDLSGDPLKGDINALLPIFAKARKGGLKLALHAAEIRDRNEENRTLLRIPPDRIGHGSCLHPDAGGEQELVDEVCKRHIPMEICITSNLLGAVVDRPENHHFGYWYEKKHPCVLCTDDKGVFMSSLSEEYLLAATTFSLSREEIWELSENAISCIFGGEEVKSVLKRIWKDSKVKLGL